MAQRRSTATLRPYPEESVNFDDTQNLYIEGDNLEVLKLLQTAYYRRVNFSKHFITQFAEIMNLMLIYANKNHTVIPQKVRGQTQAGIAYDIWFKENKWQLWPLDRYKYIDIIPCILSDHQD